ncbi:hypothetical protein M433DRAFT_200231 [Acidomyces richmondensis BFW]|nr:MAG: hypothetical protein FE78DRAFT_269222 [Acidomyces sp. 'richmondensis']KYG46483.1 hypothetical protein M433DRAFT_200231 [Acidomyces richmondensis BFW]
MGKLIKNHWARLIVLTAASYQVAASLEGFFWPKFFWDWLTKNLDVAVKPIPILQMINFLIAILTLAYEWPVRFIAGRTIHKSIGARMLWLPLCSLACVLMYQATDPALYYLIGLAIYFWAYTEGEVICAVPWTLPKRSERRPREKA